MTMEQMLEKLSVDPASVPSGEEQDGSEVPTDSGGQETGEENRDVWGQG
jgi:hypothetical protein